MSRVALGLLMVMTMANSGFAAFSFKLVGAAGPGVISGPGTAPVGGAGVYSVLASSDVGVGEVLNSYALTLNVGNPNFTFAPATAGPALALLVTTDTSVGTFAFNHSGVTTESTSLFFSGISTANGGNVFQFGGTNLNAVPEPSSMALVGLLGVGLTAVRRRRRA